jgi:hypothetical protein
MADERECTLKVLAEARQALYPLVKQASKRQRKRRRSCHHTTWVHVGHSLDGQPEELRVSPLKDRILYRFGRQYRRDRWTVEPGDTTLGYLIRLERHYTDCDPFGFLWFRSLFAPKHDASPALGTQIIRLLVVRSGELQLPEGVSPIFVWGDRHYSGDIAGWNQMIEDIGWPELRSN